jgi:hypothetical protein
MPKVISMYNGPEAMEPLLPQENNSRLAELSRDIWVNAGELSGQLSAARTKQGVANLVRNMNSYYSNLIEGHKTFPRDIEKALAHDFSGNAKERNNQALHIAHIQVDELLRSQMGGNTDPFSKDFLCWIQREFYLTNSGGAKPHPVRNILSCLVKYEITMLMYTGILHPITRF